MPAFLFLLVKWNLAMAAAIVLVWLLRRPLRLLFGAPIAYAVWFVVPIASIAILFPPRLAASLTPAPITPASAPPISALGHAVHSVLYATDQLTGQSALPAIAAPSPASMPAPLLFAAWALGALLMALYLTRLQLRFSAAVRLGEAGPAVLGFFRPRIVTPDNFQDSFTPQERAAILAHEHVHLARQDARINALTAFLRCLCWFNPLVHLGARWLRIDQELACDAAAVARTISRRDYANALLKSQMIIAALPLGCNWPGSRHPLVERIALLKRKPPGTARRLAGAGLVMLAAASLGLSAWAAQPPVAADTIAAPINPIALASPSAPSRTIAGIRNQPVVDANPVASGHHLDTAIDVHIETPIPAAPPLSKAAPLPKVAATATTTMASNSPLAAPLAPEAPPAAAATPNDQPVAPLVPQEAPAQPAQAVLDSPAATPAKTDSIEPYIRARCDYVPNSSVTGRVISSKAIQINRFFCGRTPPGSGAGDTGTLIYGGFGPSFGPCKKNETFSRATVDCSKRPPITMNVQLANPADASKMQPGTLVTLKGDFLVLTQDRKVDYLFVQNARVLYTDPFGR